MENLIKIISNDLKRNSKYFLLLSVLFLSVFYAEDKFRQKKEYKYISYLVHTQPTAISEWVTFNQIHFKQDLYHYLLKQDTRKNINKLCETKEAIQQIDMDFSKGGFNYARIDLYHMSVAKKECLNNVFNEIIYEYFNEYLEKVMNDNKILLEYLKQEDGLNLNSSLYLSTLPTSFRAPQIIEMKVNNQLKSGTNHTKIIVISIIFSAILTLIFSKLIINKKKRRKNKL